MSARLIWFPTETATCFMCHTEFRRRQNEPDRRTCPACAETLRQVHEQANDCRKIIEKSLKAAGADDPSRLIDQYLDGIQEGRL